MPFQQKYNQHHLLRNPWIFSIVHIIVPATHYNFFQSLTLVRSFGHPTDNIWAWFAWFNTICSMCIYCCCTNIFFNFCNCNTCNTIDGFPFGVGMNNKPKIILECESILVIVVLIGVIVLLLHLSKHAKANPLTHIINKYLHQYRYLRRHDNWNSSIDG